MLFTTACKYDNTLEASLEFAGSNRGELEEVLDYFSNNTQKYESAKFLIKNLPHWFSYSDNGELDSIEHLLHDVASIKDAWYFCDLTKKDWTTFNYLQYPRIYDSHIITSKLIISNIQEAYKQRLLRRWNINLSDEDFNKYVIPHRIGDEKLSDWRVIYLEAIGSMLDSIYPDGDDSLRAAEIVYSILKNKIFKYNICAKWPHRRATDLFTNTAGPCRDECDRQIYALRSVGIPCAIDTYFNSPETDTSHQWVVVRDNKTGRFIPFGEHMVEKRDSSIADWRKKGKVYRFTADMRNDRSKYIKRINNTLIPIKNYFIEDVTHEYFGYNSLYVEIKNPDKQQVLLGVFSPTGWKAIDFASKSDKEFAEFHNVEPGAIYIALIENGDNNTLIPCGMPFVFERDLTTTALTPSKRQIDICVDKKMPFMPWLTTWFSKGVGGGYFELSNDIFFNNPIKSDPMPDTLPSNFYKILFPPTPTRYIRYTVPGEEEILIGEIQVYSDSSFTNKIKCRVITQFDKYHHPERVTDDDILSFFSAPLNCRSIILQLDAPSIIEGIGFIPRNNDNFVWQKQKYQLLYFDSLEKGWVSVGEKTAYDREISFKIPDGSLCWLRNLTKGQEEQVFIWRNNHQIFTHDL